MVLRTLPSFDSGDLARVDEMRLRRRLLNGEHEEDVKEAIRLAFGMERASVHKWVDVAANSYVQLWTTLAALYAFPARVTANPGMDGSERVIAAVERVGHWARMPRTQRDVLALREVFVLLSWDAQKQTLQERVIYPDQFETPRPCVSDPTAIAAIAVWYCVGGTWQRHEYQVEDEVGMVAPRHRVTDDTGAMLNELAGDAYPYRDMAGYPIIPGVLYHAAETGTLLDWHTGRDIVRGAVRLMVFYTGAGHVIVDASWIQRYSVNVEWIGAGQSTDGTSHIVADPATILQGDTRANDGNSPPMIGSFPQPADPEAVIRTIAMYARQLAASAGVRSPEATRTESDIRSGYSLAVSREAVMEMQAGYAPTFRRADQAYMHVAACLMGVRSVSPADWGIQYQAIGMPPAEYAQRLAVIKDALELGLMSTLDATLFLYPSLTVAEAEAKIAASESTKPADTELPDDVST